MTNNTKTDKIFSALPSRLNGFIFNTKFFFNFQITESIKHMWNILTAHIYLNLFQPKKGIVKGQCIIYTFVLSLSSYVSCFVHCHSEFILYRERKKVKFTAFDMPIMCTRSKSNVFGLLCCFLFYPQSANIQTVYIHGGTWARVIHTNANKKQFEWPKIDC